MNPRMLTLSLTSIVGIAALPSAARADSLPLRFDYELDAQQIDPLNYQNVLNNLNNLDLKVGPVDFGKVDLGVSADALLDPGAVGDVTPGGAWMEAGATAELKFGVAVAGWSYDLKTVVNGEVGYTTQNNLFQEQAAVTTPDGTTHWLLAPVSQTNPLTASFQNQAISIPDPFTSYTFMPISGVNVTVTPSLNASISPNGDAYLLSNGNTPVQDFGEVRFNPSVNASLTLNVSALASGISASGAVTFNMLSGTGNAAFYMTAGNDETNGQPAICGTYQLGFTASALGVSASGLASVIPGLPYSGISTQGHTSHTACYDLPSIAPTGVGSVYFTTTPPPGVTGYTPPSSGGGGYTGGYTGGGGINKCPPGGCLM